jgi:signal transduction histidine kinase
VAPDPDRYLAAMHTDIAALGALIDDLFVLTRLEAGDVELTMETVDLDELIETTIEAVVPVAEQRAVTVEAESDRLTVTGSWMALQRALRNLLDNAVRHTPEGTRVFVRGRAQEDSVEVTVADEGPGFPEEFRRHAFDSFTRADSSRARAGGGGAGLGLAIAKAIVEAHAGEIWIDDGGGGRVSFRLPLRPRT